MVVRLVGYMCLQRLCTFVSSLLVLIRRRARVHVFSSSHIRPSVGSWSAWGRCRPWGSKGTRRSELTAGFLLLFLFILLALSLGAGVEKKVAGTVAVEELLTCWVVWDIWACFYFIFSDCVCVCVCVFFFMLYLEMHLLPVRISKKIANGFLWDLFCCFYIWGTVSMKKNPPRSLKNARWHGA